MSVKSLISKIYRCFVKEGRMVHLAQKAGVQVGKGNEFMSKFWEYGEPYLIEVGNNCQITRGVKFFTHGGGKVLREIDPSFDIFGKIRIGNNVYIGNNVLIMPGVSCGDNVLIAAGAVVTKSIPNDVVIAGNPAKIVCTLEDYYNRNKIYNMKTKGLSTSQKKKILLGKDDICFINKRLLS